ncbi:MAG: hypothetical protein ACR2G1_06850 [Rubrobacteraceae bacterium]
MPGYERAEVTAELTVRSPEDTNEAFDAAKRSAGETGLARDAGPEALMLAGGRVEVLEAVGKVLEAALEAGAREVNMKVEAEADADSFSSIDP